MRWIALGMAMWLSGCSFAFVSGPPPRHEELTGFSCTESRVAPVLDTIFAVLQGANFLFAAASNDKQWSDSYQGDPPFARSTAIPLYVVLALLGTGGAYYGFKNTGECRDAKRQALIRMQNGTFGRPQGWPPAAAPGAPPPGAPSPYAPPLAPGPYAPAPSPYSPAPAPSPYAPPPAPSPYAPPPAPSPYAPPSAPPTYGPPPAAPPAYGPPPSAPPAYGPPAAPPPSPPAS